MRFIKIKNIILVKVGSLYNENHVNKLYNSLNSSDSKFWCYTENAEGINPNINIIKPICTLKKWWNKLALFSDKMPYEGECLFFDLDIEIKKSFFLPDFKGLTLLYDYTKEYLFWRPHAYDVKINSSMMAWTHGEQTEIWNKFYSNRDYYMRKYPGIDRFIEHENIEYKIRNDLINIMQVNDRPEAPIYSYNGMKYELTRKIL